MGSIQFPLEVRAAGRALQEQRLPLLSCASSELGAGSAGASVAFQTHPDVLLGLICNTTQTIQKRHLFKLVIVSVLCLGKEKAC